MSVLANYSFMDLMWSMFVFFMLVTWIMILFQVFADIFRRRDCGGWKKFFWLLFVIFLPFLGVFCYIIANSNGMSERKMKDMAEGQAEMDQYIRTVASSGSSSEEVARAHELLKGGAINQAEYEAMKRRALGS